MMTIPTLQAFSKIYPVFVQKYDTFLPSDDNTIITKINSIVDNLNKVGSLTNNVVDNWNTVMAWVLSNGVTDEVVSKIQEMVTNGDFDAIVNQNLLTDINTHLTTIDSSLAEIAINIKHPPAPLVPAKGDNVTDDSVAINSILNYAYQNNKSVYIPKSEYKCLAQDLSITCNVYGDGEKSIIYGKVRVDSSNVRLKDFKLVGNKNGDLLYIAGHSDGRLSNIVIEGVHTDYLNSTDVAYRNSIQASYIDAISIKNCNIKYGVNLASCTNFLVDGNIIDGLWLNQTELIQCTLKSSGVITNNHLLNTTDNFIDLFSSGERVVIHGNRMIGCRSKWGQGIEIKVSLSDDPTNTSSDSLGWAESIIITNNIMKDFTPFGNYPHQGISIYYIDNRAVKTFNWSDVPKNILIHDNIIEGYDDTNSGFSTPLFKAIELNQCWGISIKNNIIRDIKTSVLNANTTCCVSLRNCHDILITGNKMSIDKNTVFNFYEVNYELIITENIIGDDEKTNQIPEIAFNFSKPTEYLNSDLSNSIISNNIIKCTKYAFKASYSNSSLTEMVIQGNKFIRGALWLMQMQFSMFSGNSVYCDYDVPIILGRDDGVICKGNIINDNRIKANSKPGLVVYNQQGSNINSNIFSNTDYAIKLYGVFQNCNIRNTISITQTMPNVVNYMTVSAGDQATNIIDGSQKVA